MNVVFVAVNAKFAHTNLAVRYFHSLCKESLEFTTSFAEYTINNPKEMILQELMGLQANVICFSCYIWNIQIITDISSSIRKIAPQIKIIWGGPEAYWDDTKSSISTFPYPCDYLITGEGEYALIELLHQIAKNTPSTQQHITCSNPFPLDQLPFPYSHDELYNNLHKTFYYETSRGCPFHCSYCLSGSDHGVRFKSITKIKEELDYFINAQVPRVKLVDRTFNCNKALCKSIWKYLIENNNHVTCFHFEISADLLDQEMLELLELIPHGLVQLEVGIQSTNPATLQAIRRETNLERVFHAIDRIYKGANVHLHLDLIAGLPLEDMDGFKNSFCQVFSHHPQQLQLGFLKLLKGSPLEKEYQKFSMKFNDFPPYEILSTDSIAYLELLEIKRVETVLEAYYNSHRFDHMLSYLIPFFPTAFAFFSALGKFYYQQQNHLIPLSKDGQYDFLYQFSKQISSADSKIVAQLCKMDIFCHEKPNKQPSWVSPNAFSKNAQIQWLSLYKEHHLPLDVSLSPQELGRWVHLEQFDFPIHLHDYTPCPTLLLFDYRHRNLLGHAQIIPIPHEHYPQQQ